ncbi:MAG: serine hydrolase domain-containing protein [Pyrinomonadaceae bacterium]
MKFLAAASVLLLLTSSALADRIDDYIRAQMRRNHIPGVSVAVVKDGRVVKLAGYGVANLEWRRPVTPSTVFQIASATKIFTGLAVMSLVDEGKIALSDSVRAYLPEAPASWQAITVRHLATHSSGLSDDIKVPPDASVANYVEAAYKTALVYEPGTRSQYGFTDFVVLQHVLEKVTGQSYEQLLESRIFGPSGMSDSRFDHAADQGGIRVADVVAGRAEVYNWENGRHRKFWFLFRERGYSAGGLLTSAADLAKLAVALDRGKLVSDRGREAIWRRDMLGDGSQNSFGVGWVVDEYSGRQTVGHSGGPALADILRFPRERLTIAVLTNGQRLFPYLARGIADVYFPRPAVKPSRPITDSDADLTRLVRKFIADGMRDTVDETLFTTDAQAELVPAFRRFGLPLFGQLDPLASLDLIEEISKDGEITRKYRAIHGSKAVLWVFVFDKNKKIKSLDPTIE